MGVSSATGRVALSLEFKVQTELPTVLGAGYFLPSCGRCVDSGVEAEAILYLERLRGPWIEFHCVLVSRCSLGSFLGGLGWVELAMETLCGVSTGGGGSTIMSPGM